MPNIHRHIPAIFLVFRLVYIPASVLSHTGHGLPWLTVVAALIATFGMETLARRSRVSENTHNSSQARWLVVVALLLLGLFPEEAPIGLILWAAIGAAWGRQEESAANRYDAAGLVAGALLGLSGLWGPGSWLMAGLLAFWVRTQTEST